MRWRSSGGSGPAGERAHGADRSARARSEEHRALERANRARAQRRDLRSARGEPFPPDRRVCRPLSPGAVLAREQPRVPGRGQRRAGPGRGRPGDPRVPTGGQGLFLDLRQLFPGDQGYFRLQFK